MVRDCYVRIAIRIEVADDSGRAERSTAFPSLNVGVPDAGGSVRTASDTETACDCPMKAPGSAWGVAEASSTKISHTSAQTARRARRIASAKIFRTPVFIS